MKFQSVDFIIFMVLVVTLYWRLPLRAQNLLLVLASLVFYGWVHPWFPALMLVSVVTDALCSRAMLSRPARRRTFLAISLTINLGLLATFKYLDFFIINVRDVFSVVGVQVPIEPLKIILPVGISFYTFQTMSFTVDVYRGDIKVVPRFLDQLLFVSFFPQLVAGPIERAGHLLSQLSAERRFRADEFRDGIFLLCWGFFQKLVIADNVAVTADKIFSLADPSFPLVWAGVVAFSIQIYADFSAYSDIARGSAALLGVTLMRNFNHPYLSQSPPEFWRRWHISLSTWFRDYVYVPLGGNRGTTARWVRNTVIVFGLSGLWHGASWNYVIWGLYWAGLILAHRVLVAVVPASIRAAALVAPLSVVVMFVLANIGWLFFRETESAALWRDLWLSPADAPLLHWEAAAFFVLHTALLGLPLAVSAFVDTRMPSSSSPSTARLLLRAAGAVLCLIGIAMLRADASAAFIYFQF